MESTQLNKLIEGNYKRIFLLALKMLKNYEDAEDATQEIFLKVYENIGSFRKESKFTTWIYRIALNHIYYMSNKKKKELNSMPESHEVQTQMNANPATVLQEKELFDSLEKAIEELPPRQKEIFIMRYYNQLPFKKISQILKKSLGTVKSSYFFAMQKIKNELQDQHMMDFQE